MENLRINRSISLFRFNVFAWVMFFMILPVLGNAFSDKYEDDDVIDNARLLMLNDQKPEHQSIPGYEWRQFHNFHDAGDNDWVYFYGFKRDELYNVSVSGTGKNCDAVIQIYYENQHNLIRTVDNYVAGKDEYVEWKCPQDGIYYARIYQYDPEVYGQETHYQLMLHIPKAVFDGYVYGRVMPNVKTVLTTNGLGSAITTEDGAYFMPHLSGNFILTAESQRFPSEKIPITVQPLEYVKLDILFSQEIVIDAVADAGGKIDPSGSVPANPDDSIRFNITPDPGNSIKSVTVDGLAVGAVGEYVFEKVASSHTIRASFKSAQVKPGIQTQHTDQLAVAPAGEPVCLTLQLNPGDQAGRNADWWVGFYRLAPLPNMFVSLTANGWLPQLARLFDYPLFAFKDVELPVALAPGEYLFFFAVDDNADAVLDATWFDMAQVVVK